MFCLWRGHRSSGSASPVQMPSAAPRRKRRTRGRTMGRALLPLCLIAGTLVAGAALAQEVLTGKDALSDWTRDAPGVRRKITAADLPPPGATRSASHQARIVQRPADVVPKAPPGFTIAEFAH